jgi:hypothetical protein
MKKLKRLICAVILGMMLCILAFPAEASAQKTYLNKTSVTVYIGKTTTLKVINGSGTVKWSSSDSSVATVSSKGKITGKKAGTAVITAKVNSKTYKCKVTVKTSFQGSYSNSTGDELTITSKNGTCRIEISLYRLTYIDDGTGYVKNNVLHFTATDANGKTIQGIIKKSGKQVTLKFTKSSWTYLPKGTTYYFSQN